MTACYSQRLGEETLSHCQDQCWRQMFAATRTDFATLVAIEPDWRLKPLHCPVKSNDDRLGYAFEHEWNIAALHDSVLACVSEQPC